MIWLERKANVLYQEEEPIVSLSPLERNLLIYFLNNPRVNLTKSEIIRNCWPSDAVLQGVSDDSLFRLIRSLRQKLTKEEDEFSSYIVNWRGYPEGGYRFLPDGKEQGANEVMVQQSLDDTLEQLVALKQIISNQLKTILLLEEILDEVTEKIHAERVIEKKNGRIYPKTAVHQPTLTHE